MENIENKETELIKQGAKNKDTELIKENTLILKKPILIDGETVNFIEYDMDKLNGRSIEAAIKELGRKSIAVTAVEISPPLHAQLFAYAAGLDISDIERFSMKDYVKAVEIIRDFFLED